MLVHIALKQDDITTGAVCFSERELNISLRIRTFHTDPRCSELVAARNVVEVKERVSRKEPLSPKRLQILQNVINTFVQA